MANLKEELDETLLKLKDITRGKCNKKFSVEDLFVIFLLYFLIKFLMRRNK